MSAFSDAILCSNATPAAFAASMSPVSPATSSGASHTIRSQAATTSGSISRCSGRVEPIDTTSMPSRSQRPRRMGVSSRDLAAATTMLAPSTARSALATGSQRTESSRPRSAASASRLAGVGL